MKIRVDFELTDKQVEALVSQAIIYAYLRDEPRARWTEAERKDAVRYAIQHIIFGLFSEKGE